MKFSGNIIKSVTFYVITILFLSLSYIKIYSSLATKYKTIVLCDDSSSEKEISDSEECSNEDQLDLFFLENKNMDIVDFYQHFPKMKSTFLIPKVIFDIKLPPPEA
jgi:hypothetical protein